MKFIILSNIKHCLTLYFKILIVLSVVLFQIMSLVLNLMFEEILFLVSYFISVRHKHAAGLHRDMVLRNVHEIKCKMF